MKKTINRKIVKESNWFGCVRISIYETFDNGMEWPLKTYLKYDDGHMVVPFTCQPLGDIHPVWWYRLH